MYSYSVFFLRFFVLFKIILSENFFLKKYSSIKVTCSKTKKIVFDSSEFNETETMYFVFKLNTKGLEDNIYYQFYDNLDTSDYSFISGKSASNSKKPYRSTNSKKKNKIKSQTKYYSINQEKDSNFLLLQYDCSKGTLTIENTKKDTGKTNKIVTIVVVCAIVLLFIIMFVCVYIRKRKANLERQQQMTGTGYFPQNGVSLVSGIGNNNMMMNNYPQQNNIMIGQQPIPYSQIQKAHNQLSTNVSNAISKKTSERKILSKKKKPKIKK